MKRSALGVLLLFFAAAAGAGQWRYSDSTDKMTGKTESFAYIESDNSLVLEHPYQGVNRGTITVRRHPKYGLDVLVSIEKGQVLCRSYDPCTIGVRFDDGKPQRFSALPPADHSTETVFITNKTKFIASARKAKRILVQLPIYRNGEPVLEFSTPVELVWK